MYHLLKRYWRKNWCHKVVVVLAIFIAFDFGIMYGMGVLALRQNLGSTREEAQNYLNQYFYFVW